MIFWFSPALIALIALVAAATACSSSSDDGGERRLAGSGGASSQAGSGGTPLGAGTGPGAGAGGVSGVSGGGGTLDGSNSGGQAGGDVVSVGGAGGAGTEISVWQPMPGTTWQWQLTGAIDTSVDAQVFDIDLVETPQATIDELTAAGRKVICYFSAGSSEDWRPDFSAFQQSDQGNDLDGWPGERWLDIRSSNVREIMRARLDLAQNKACHGVEPDNVDGYANDNGLGLTRNDQLDYLAFLVTEAHARGLSIGLKNALELVTDVVSDFDWALDEECLAYDECDALAPFIAANKAVFHVEYGDESLLDQVCSDPSTNGFSTLIKNLELDAWRLTCP